MGKSDKGGYKISAPSLPGCISEGEIVEEVIDNIIEAVELYLEPINDDSVALNDVIIKKINL